MAGAGNGFVDEFATTGVLVRRFASGGTLNSPWGVALAPSNFGIFSNDLLIGNFGDGRINAYKPDGTFDGGEFLEGQEAVAVLVLLGKHFGGLGGVFLGHRAGLPFFLVDLAVAVRVELLEHLSRIALGLFGSCSGFAGFGLRGWFLVSSDRERGADCEGGEDGGN